MRGLLKSGCTIIGPHLNRFKGHIETMPKELREWADRLEFSSDVSPEGVNSSCAGAINGDRFRLEIWCVWKDRKYD